MPLVRIIIVNFNGGDNLRRCLAALAAQSERQFEVVIVDNNSTDSSLANLPTEPRAEIIRSQTNLGFAAGCNRGFEGCTTPFVVFLNADAFAQPGWLATLLRAAERYPQAASFGSLQLNASDPKLLDGAGDVYSCAGSSWRGGYHQPVPNSLSEGETFSPCAAAAMYRSDWFAKAGGFDERYFCYCEDTDLGFRVRLLGGLCVQVGDAIVHHVGSSQNGANSPFPTYQICRNQSWTFVKCMPAMLFWPLLPLHILYVSYRLVRLGNGPAGAEARRGVADAWRGLGVVWRQRRAVQKSRTASVPTIARALSWSPLALVRHPVVLRPLRRG